MVVEAIIFHGDEFSGGAMFLEFLSWASTRPSP
jgi:hypothetical protein